MTWIEIKTKEDLPVYGGTKAVVYKNSVTTAWMFYAPESQTWHPFRGWKTNIGQPWNFVHAYMELPEWNLKNQDALTVEVDHTLQHSLDLLEKDQDNETVTP